MHSRVFILADKSIELDDGYTPDMDRIFEELEVRVGADGLDYSEDIDDDIKWLADNFKDVVDIEHKLVDMRLLKNDIVKTANDMFKTNIDDYNIAIAYANYEEVESGFFFLIIDENGVETLMSQSQIIADYGRYLLNKLSVIDWSKGDLRYKIVNVLDYHM